MKLEYFECGRNGVIKSLGKLDDIDVALGEATPGTLVLGPDDLALYREQAKKALETNESARAYFEISPHGVEHLGNFMSYADACLEVRTRSAVDRSELLGFVQASERLLAPGPVEGFLFSGASETWSGDLAIVLRMDFCESSDPDLSDDPDCDDSVDYPVAPAFANFIDPYFSSSFYGEVVEVFTESAPIQIKENMENLMLRLRFNDRGEAIALLPVISYNPAELQLFFEAAESFVNAISARMTFLHDSAKVTPLFVGNAADTRFAVFNNLRRDLLGGKASPSP